jgi:hypothetical protein
MNIPVLVLLAFAMWTLLVLCAGVGVYRWNHILTGRTSVAHWWTCPFRKLYPDVLVM